MSAAAVTNLVPSEPDVKLIAACETFSTIELRCIDIQNAAVTMEDDRQANKLIAQLRGDRDPANHWPVVNQICTTPGSSHAAAVALATALAVWEFSENRAPEDDPSDYVTKRITAALIRCLLGCAAA